MTAFDDLGLREELLRTLEEENLEAATALQAAVIPVLRRGGNLVARAGSGAGKTLAYGLGVLDRLPVTPTAEENEEDEENTPVGARILLLLPTEEEAEHAAVSLFPYAQAAGFSITTADGSWATPLERAEVLVATPGSAMEAVRGSAMKLDTLEALIIDGARAIQELGAWELVDTLLDHVPRDAQRVLFTSALTEEIEDLVDRRIKRALRYPPAPAVADAEPPAPEGEVGYVVAAEREKIELLARLLSGRREGDVPPVLHCRTDERAAQVAELLTMRGFLVGELSDQDSDVAVVAAGTSRAELVEDAGVEPARTISYDVPSDAETLRARHAGDPKAVIFVEPRELAHLHDITAQALLVPRAFTAPADVPTAHSARLEQFRQDLQQALREEDLAAQILVLQPLLDEHPAVEIAAAATALLRSRRPTAAAAAAVQPLRAATPAAAAPGAAVSPPRSDAGPAPATFVRLYVGVGNRDGLRPGDLVGAIAGEANIPGSRVGKIEIRDNFSIVEVQAEVAEQVIAAVNGTTIKGRSVRVDYDRGADRARRTPERGGPPTGRGREAGSRPRPPVRRPREE
ncbi:MAG TPA: DbpA RNA binding domain-containing protein [Longimicrobiaceae bacterium]|nr:DbpA RNA binding domain-containing protein [Longimicrobiaceae bacterium]